MEVIIKSTAGTRPQFRQVIRATFISWRFAHIAFMVLCLVCEAILFAYDRSNAYIGLDLFACGLLLWLITRTFIKIDPSSEDSVLKTTASGWRLFVRLLIVVLTLAFVMGFYTFGGPSLVRLSGAEDAVQRLSGSMGFVYGDTPLPNFIMYALLPGVLLFAFGAKPIELGLTAWRKGGWYALLGAFVLPAIFIGIWFSNGHATIGLLVVLLLRNFLSNGFSEEFLFRGMTLSHLRALLSKEWAMVLQAILFGLFHLGGTLVEERGNWVLAIAHVIALDAPIGYFFALIALRARSIVLPALIHMSMDATFAILRGN